MGITYCRHKHNPYAEWYFNTIRIKDSPASKHHREVYDDAPYDDLLINGKLVISMLPIWSNYLKKPVQSILCPSRNIM
jgi:hypothetical protein